MTPAPENPKKTTTIQNILLEYALLADMWNRPCIVEDSKKALVMSILDYYSGLMIMCYGASITFDYLIVPPTYHIIFQKLERLSSNNGKHRIISYYSLRLFYN